MKYKGKEIKTHLRENVIHVDAKKQYIPPKGIERHICFDDTNRPEKYYFEFDDGFRSKIGLKKEVFDNPRFRITYEITAWAELPEPYHKRTRKACPVKDIPAFLDQLDNDDLNGHLKKEDY